MKQPIAMLQVNSLRDVVPTKGREIVVRLANCYGSSRNTAFEAYQRAREHLSRHQNKPPFTVSIVLVSEDRWTIDDSGTIRSKADIVTVGEYTVNR